MAFTNSPLVDYTKISPNRTKNRNHAIDTITIHCVVGQCSVETLGSIFAPTERQASSNYGIGVDGRIGMYCEEKDRSWCSSNAANDHRAITIEVASDTQHPYAVNDKAYAALIDLCVDICKRNGITKLVWSTSKEDRVNHLNGCNMTVHRDYANKSCPGEYLYERHGEIAAKVNARLEGTSQEAPEEEVEDVEPTEPAVTIQVKDLVEITGTKYYGGQTIPDWVKAKRWYVRSIAGDRVVINKSEDGKNSIMSPVRASDLRVVTAAPTPETYRIHTVVKGDSLWAIAQNYLGDGSRYKELKTLNGLTSNVIYTGWKLKIPN